MTSFRYQALAPLPSSGSSRSFLGIAIMDETRAEPVVLVWVPEEIARDVEKSEGIQRETERAALLEHPHIIRVYGFARLEDERLARVVEFADGENLRRVLDRLGPLPPPLAARLIADAAQGVHYAHLAGNDDGTPLLHGDLRPETLLITHHGLCKVSGYGAAAFAPKESSRREMRAAPEQILGGRAAMNVQTDVYLLAATLFECITGKAPFEGEAAFEQAVLTKELGFAAWPQIPESLRVVLARALAKKAAERFPSPQVFREAITLALPAMPEHDEIAEWLTENFPDADGSRAERQRIIDAGIAGFARAQWDRQAASPSTHPPFPRVVAAPPPTTGKVGTGAPAGSSAAAPPPSAAAPKAPKPPSPTGPAAAATARTPPKARHTTTVDAEDDEAPPRPRNAMLPAIVVVGLVAAIALVFILLGRRGDSGQAYPPGMTTRVEPEASADSGMAAGALQDAGGGAAVAAVTADDAGATGADEPQVADVDPAQDAGTDAASAQEQAAATGLEEGVLALTVEPRVAVKIDGKPVGRAPVRVPLPPGRYKIELEDRGRGIDVTRYVRVAARGVTEEEIYLQKGFVAINAPPGAIVAIDGKRVGKAPLPREVEVYEGSHKLEVTMGKAKFRESFRLRAGQRVYFDVGPQYQ